MQSYLCEEKEAKDYVNPSFQGLNNNGLIEKQEEDQWKLQQDTEQPETGQLWNLKKVEKRTRDIK